MENNYVTYEWPHEAEKSPATFLQKKSTFQFFGDLFEYSQKINIIYFFENLFENPRKNKDFFLNENSGL